MPQYLLTSSSKTVGGVFLLDSKSGSTRRLMSGGSRGITQGPDGAYYVVSGTRNPEDGDSTVHRLAPTGAPDTSEWSVELIAKLPVADAHDFRWLRGSFYLVCSLGNQLLRLDPQCRIQERMQIVEDERDICHVNCLTERDGELYCTIFTLTPGERAEKRLTGAWHTEGKLLRLDWERKRFEIAYEPLGQPHSLVPHGEWIYLVESHFSRLSRIHVERGVSEHLRQYNGFLRGLHLGPDEAVMGVCVMYQRDRKRLQPIPAHQQWLERKFPFSGVVVLDPRNWRTRKRIPLEGAEVYDLLPLDGAHSPAAAARA